MSEKMLQDAPGKKVLVLGNEALVRGALESGVQFASTFPGTPASEIGDTWARISKESGVYFEYSVNEKVAFEVAAGAAMSGLRSMVSMKHFGLNVALDSIFPVAYVGVEGGLVVVFADDPNGWSSAQSEQDSRPLARMAHMPMLEPSDAQESKDIMGQAFDLSERFRVPVFLRMTTRVSHTRTPVTLGKIVHGDRKAMFVKDPVKYNNMPPKIIEMHKDMQKKIEDIRKLSEKSPLNRIVDGNARSKIGIITAGGPYNYVVDALATLGIKVPILKLGFTHPIPDEMVRKFIGKYKKVLVVEELEPFLEDQVRALAKDANPKLEIIGKRGDDNAVFSVAGEYTPDLLVRVLCKLLGRKPPFDYDAHAAKFNKLIIPARMPVFCPGCPHRATFYAVKKAAGKDAVFGGDIGCYIIGIFPPFETQDFAFSMGSGMGVTHGIKKAEDQTGASQKVISFVGDGTFFHAGIPPLLNMVYNKSNVLVIIMDNRVTAMTGHQPNPGSGHTSLGDEVEPLELEPIVRACGVKYVKTVDPYRISELEAAVKEYMGNDSVSVIIAKHKCFLLEAKDLSKAGIIKPKFEVEGPLEAAGIESLENWGCPALHRDKKGQIMIDESICAGCGACVQLAPGKIKAKDNQPKPGTGRGLGRI
jgi:indolepyruvate ferredoxin oxidoreductase, alpha subunit